MSTPTDPAGGGNGATHDLCFGPIVIRFDDSVIRPRPWTLAQSQWAAEAARRAPPGPILELCCGAGHIGLAAAVLSRRSLVQVDASAAACELARCNAEANGLGSVVEVRHRPLDEAIDTHERFPLIIADPPYLRSAVVAAYADPPHAIDGGYDGLDLVAACVTIAAGHLDAGGIFSLQLAGPRQWIELEPRVAPDLRFVELRSYGPDRSLVHLIRS